MEDKESPTVYFCTNMRYSSSSPSCGMRGSKLIMEMVRAEMRKRGRSYPIEEFICLGQCSGGPAIRIAPGGKFHLGGSKFEIQEIADWIEQEMGKLGISGKEECA